MKRNKPVIGEIYHIYNRGVEKRDTFLNKEDYLRFLYSLFAFNDERPVLNAGYFFTPKSIEVGLQYGDEKREKMVEILAFILMKNHFHLLLKQTTENGIIEFMRKLGTGYTNAFNIKYKRVGPLFQGAYKNIHVQTNQQILYLPFYIHLNPLDYVEPGWREGKIKNTKRARDFITKYPWSSHHVYGDNPLSFLAEIVDSQFLRSVFGDSYEYQKGLLEWLDERKSGYIDDIMLE